MITRQYQTGIFVLLGQCNYCANTGTFHLILRRMAQMAPILLGLSNHDQGLHRHPHQRGQNALDCSDGEQVPYLYVQEVYL